MKKPIKQFSILLISILATGFAFADNTFKWPKGKKAAVNLAYDDALNSQLDIAIPALNKYGFTGSFYIPIHSDTVAKRLPEWRAAAKKGHELANHSLFHQCSKTGPGREWVTDDHNLDKMSVGQMKEQVVLANVVLHAIDGKTERTYTAPCIDSKAGGENYIDAVKSEFVAIKLSGGGVTADMNSVDPYNVSVDFPVDTTGEKLIARVKEAAEKGTMVNFTFHGVGGDHLSVTKDAHEELLKYLADNKDIYWVDTFVNIMKYVKEEQKKK
jgi:peptidoglycan/xylan/chitin deacetylase (PgdA/CDA1 family)